jgi:hypothetical protein
VIVVGGRYPHAGEHHGERQQAEGAIKIHSASYPAAA